MPLVKKPRLDNRLETETIARLPGNIGSNPSAAALKCVRMRARKKPNVMERGSVPCFSVFFRPNHESAAVALLQSPFLTLIVTIEQRSVLTNFFLKKSS
jgi:hypothetical protein